MPYANVSSELKLAGSSTSVTKSVEVDNAGLYSETVEAGLDGTMVDEDTITVTGHSFQVGDTIGVFWDGGKRVDLSITAVSGDDIDVSGGYGDTLPAASTAVVVSKQAEIDLSLNGDGLQELSVDANISACVAFMESGGVKYYAEPTDGNPVMVDVDGGATNPLSSSTITSAHAYSKETNSGQVNILIGYNNA